MRTKNSQSSKEQKLPQEGYQPETRVPDPKHQVMRWPPPLEGAIGGPPEGATGGPPEGHRREEVIASGLGQTPADSEALLPLPGAQKKTPSQGHDHKTGCLLLIRSRTIGFPNEESA